MNPRRLSWKLAATAGALLLSSHVAAAITCARTLTADVVAFDQPIMFNRLGAANVNGMMYALRRDVVNKSTLAPLTVTPAGAVAGQVMLRPDKRTRPLILRVAAGDGLPWRQEAIVQRGAAIEVRVYAEDPAKNFLPSPGTLSRLDVPAGAGIASSRASWPAASSPRTTTRC